MSLAGCATWGVYVLRWSFGGRQSYLLSFRAHHQWNGHSLESGDVILIVEDGARHSQWKVAVIEELFVLTCTDG